MFSGKKQDWPAWERKKKGFKITGMPKAFFKTPDPSKRDRVTVAYDVPDDVHDDPTGAAAGTRVRVESVPAYQRNVKNTQRTTRSPGHGSTGD